MDGSYLDLCSAPNSAVSEDRADVTNGSSLSRLRATSRRTPQRAKPLFNHLVGTGEQRRWHHEAERLGGFGIDDQFEVRRLQYRQVGGLGAAEDLSGVNAGLAVRRSKAWPIADQAARCDEFTPVVD